MLLCGRQKAISELASKGLYKQTTLTVVSAILDSLCGFQAKEFGEAEVWMNERLMRVAPDNFAKFITAFEDGDEVTPGEGPAKVTIA